MLQIKNLFYHLQSIQQSLIVIAVGLLICCLNSVVAQEEFDPSELALKIAAAQKENMASLKNYSWKQRIDLQQNGESNMDVLLQVRFNSEGKMETTKIGGESKVTQQRGLRGRAQKSKMQELQNFLDETIKLSAKYVFMSKGQMVDFFDQAKITESTEMGGTIKVSGQNLFVDDDELIQWVDGTTLLNRKQVFKTSLGEDAINGEIEYKSIKDGPSRPLKIVMDVPSKGLKIITENFDYMLQQ